MVVVRPFGLDRAGGADPDIRSGCFCIGVSLAPGLNTGTDLNIAAVLAFNTDAAIPAAVNADQATGSDRHLAKLVERSAVIPGPVIVVAKTFVLGLVFGLFGFRLVLGFLAKCVGRRDADRRRHARRRD